MERDRSFNQIEKRIKETESISAVMTLSLSDYLDELKKINSSLPHVLWQTRQ